jgi:two-component system cell cycle response regulator DivK
MEDAKFQTTYLPPEDVESAIQDEETDSKKGYLVLLVDDLTDNLQMMSLNLQNLGYRVVTATNGEDAVEVATLTRPDLILMDIAMPVLDGLGAARKIRQDVTLEHIPIIALSAFSTDGFLQAAYDVGFDGYLTKPIDLDKLQDLITKFLPAT